MAAVLRSSVGRLFALHHLAGKMMPTAASAQMQRHISSKATREIEGIKRPPPFDYKKKDYNFFNAMIDVTTSRFDDNTKVILVEGPVAAGKTAFGEQLAQDLDMLFVPGVNMDDYFINAYGFDMRKLDPLLPVKARSFDTNDFLKDPNHINVAAYQFHMLRLKFEKYFDGLTHLLNTGQGVVIERSVYSDFVFVEAMFRAGHISRNFQRAYYEIRDNVLAFLLLPHLVIYLDVPVDGVQANIKKRNDPIEVNSPAIKNINFLKDIEYFYKHEFLKEINKSSELLVYDWSNGGEVELVVEDIERIDFDRFEKHDSKLHDWRFIPKERDWRDTRRLFTCESLRDETMRCFEMPIFYCEELLLSPEESKIMYETWISAPGMKYAPGYNAEQGDTGIWWKTGIPKDAKIL